MPRIIFNEDDDSEPEFETELGTKTKTPALEERGSDEELEDSDDSTAEDGDLVQNETDDDEAPESVSFTSGRQAALDTIKLAMEQIQKDKALTKDKRRKLDEQYKKQKEKKVALLAKRKLPEDLLASVSVSRRKAEVERKKKKKHKVTDINEKAQDDVRLGEEEQEHYTPDGFLPLDTSATGLQVVSVQEVSKVKSSSDAVLNFREKMLYGSRVPRESVKMQMSRTAKRKARQHQNR